MAVRTIGTEIKLMGEKEFNRQLTSIDSNLKNLKSELSAVSAEFTDNSNSVDALSTKQKVLQDRVEQQKIKLDALSQAYEKASAASDKDSGSLDKLLQKVNYAKVDLAKFTSELNENEAALAQAQAEAEQAAEGMDDVADAADDAARSVKRSAESVEELGDESSKTTGRLTSLAKGIGTIGGGIVKGIGQLTAVAAAGAAAVGVGGVAALTLVAETARESVEAAKAAQEAGETLTATQQQWLSYSGQLEALDASVADAKGALIGVLLPTLSDLSTKGSAFLNDFSRDMAAAGDSSQKAKVIAEYIRQGAQLIKENLPAYKETGREIISGLKEGLSEYAPEFADSAVDLVFDFLERIVSEDSATALEEGALFLIEKLKAGLQERGPDIATSGVALIGSLATSLLEQAPDLIVIAAELIGALVIGLFESLPDLVGAAIGIIGALGEYLIENQDAVISAAIELGKSIATGIWNSLVEAWNALVDIPGLMSAFSNISIGGIGDSLIGNVKPIYPHEKGLNYVPYDGYLAELHKGEMVLTRAQADLYRKGTGTGTKVFNMTINTHSLSQADVDMLVEYMNGKLGDDL